MQGTMNLLVAKGMREKNSVQAIKLTEKVFAFSKCILHQTAAIL